MICELFPFKTGGQWNGCLRVAEMALNIACWKILRWCHPGTNGFWQNDYRFACPDWRYIFLRFRAFNNSRRPFSGWLSDSPQPNEQSKQKIELKADKVRIPVRSDFGWIWPRDSGDGHIFISWISQKSARLVIWAHSIRDSIRFGETIAPQQEKKLTVCISLLMRHTAVWWDAVRERLLPSCSAIYRRK